MATMNSVNDPAAQRGPLDRQSPSWLLEDPAMARMARIICFLRDDLLVAAKIDRGPSDETIFTAVANTYSRDCCSAPWEHSVYAILRRLESPAQAATTQLAAFASAALAHLQETTQSSQLWTH